MKNQEIPDFKNLKKVHIIGVCGTLMGSFAAFLKRSGIAVTGSDQNVYPPMSDVLEKAGVELFSGYSADNLARSGKPDLVVIGNVITPQNVEAKAAIEGGFAYSSLPEAMERLMLPQTRNLVVCGTHGKTTTSSLLAHTLVHAGKKTNYFIGGVSHDLPFSFNVASLDKATPFVIEGDEYDTAFWDKVPKFNHYLPDDVVLTSVEFDHADIYEDLAAVIRAFEGLVNRIRPGGKLVACLNDAPIKELVKLSKVPVTTYGSSGSGAEYTPDNLRVENGLNVFDIIRHTSGGKPEKVVTLRIQIPGAHNALNATAVWLIARGQGLSDSEIAKACEAFKGVKRRQEERGTIDGVTVIDDFAHHPTAVRETLKALRKKYPGRRLVTVFEPRSATSRRKVFQKDYGDAFGEADSIFIANPYDQSKISSQDQFSSVELVTDLKKKGREASLLDAEDLGVKQVAVSSQKGDIIAVLSNGGFGGFIPKLLNNLKARS